MMISRKICIQTVILCFAMTSTVVRSFSLSLRGRLPLSNRISPVQKHAKSRYCTQYSMANVDSTLSTLSSLTALMKPSSDGTQFVFVGGKGGVGKTSSSSAIAIALSDAGFRTLIVSTDPAHSLGDALDVNLRSGNVVPITTENNLWALEIDVDAGKLGNVELLQHVL
jgi:Mrp family chromosome partitioning ATPase